MRIIKCHEERISERTLANPLEKKLIIQSVKVIPEGNILDRVMERNKRQLRKLEIEIIQLN